MTVRETSISFACADAILFGVISHPEQPASKGVIIVVGGPQYRVGSHRQFTLLARALAAQGHAVLRFDSRGMGDSSGTAPGFNALDADIAAAIDALTTACPAVEQVVLWGLCDGASAALLYSQRNRDERVAGLALANPWLESERAEAHAIVHSYYRQRLLQGSFWRKLLHKQINPLGRLREAWRLWRTAAQRSEAATNDTQAMHVTLLELKLPMLVLLCQRDATAQTFSAALRLVGSDFLQRANVQRVDFAEADHTFSRQEWRKEVENVTIAWLNEKCFKP